MARILIVDDEEIVYKPLDRDGFRAMVQEALGLRSQRPRDPWFREEGG